MKASESIFDWFFANLNKLSRQNFCTKFQNSHFLQIFSSIFLFLRFFEIFKKKFDIFFQHFYRNFFRIFFFLIFMKNFLSHLNFLILAFSTNFCPIRSDQSGNTISQQASGFQKVTFLAFLINFCPLKM